MTTKVEKTVTVDVPVSTAYNQWTQFEEFPEFMSGVTQVEQLDDDRLHWVAEIAGVRREWYAAIVDQQPDVRVAWAATEGATNAGAVSFAPAGPGQSVVTLELEYEPEGLVEKVGDALSIVERQATADLESFKTFIESRGSETGEWRGSVEGDSAGTPSADTAAASQGDSGKTGISGKAAAVGVTAAAAGVAAVAAAVTGSGSDDEDSASPGSPSSEAPAMTEAAPPQEAYVMPAGAEDGLLTDDVELDSYTPGVTDVNDGDLPSREM